MENNIHELVSVIVPIYNAEKYISICIENVISQTYQNWELLLIDDGSTDSSYEICKKYALNDTRIKAIHKNNSGVSNTRNYGLEIASGEFIIFLDADDYWNDITSLSKMYSLLNENNADICCADFKEVDGDGKDIINNRTRKKENKSYDIFNSVDFLQIVINKEFFLWRSLIRRSFIGNLKFNTNRVFLEDAEYYLRLLQNPSSRCVYLPLTFYSYRKHSGAVTVKPSINNNKLRDAFNFTRLCFSLSEETNDKNMSDYLITEGIENFMFDVRVIVESKKLYKEHAHWFVLWNVEELYADVRNKSIVAGNGKYKSLRLPFSMHVMYLRYKFCLKSFIKKILGK